jgi:hypothetical protein
MPRPKNPANAAKNAQQARWRYKRSEVERRPESSEVDIALAASASAYADQVDRVPRGEGDFRTALDALLRGAVDILIERGWPRDRAVQMLRWRTSKDCRKDLEKLVRTSRMRKRLSPLLADRESESARIS